jgi:methionyl aminopeptidase
LSITLKTRREIEALRRSNRIVVEVLNELRESARPGVSTMDLELRARKWLSRETKAKPAFLGYRGYPAVLCASINEEVVHGIPSDKRVLKEGDILSIDFGVELDGYFGDAAVTVPIGAVDAEKARLLTVTRECLERAIAASVPGNHLSDLAAAVQGHAEQSGFSVVYQFVGHGIGRKMHEEPQIPNCGVPRPDVKLAEGMVLAIEPMINAGTADVEVLDDGWTAVTADRRPSAHFEKSVAVGKDGPDVLSPW